MTLLLIRLPLRAMVAVFVVGCLGAFAAAPSGPLRTAPGFNVRQRVLDSFGRIPLHFEANRGQTDSRVRFLARSSGFSLFLTPDETVLSVPRRHAASEPPAGSGPEATGGDAPAVLRMKLTGANPSPRMRGLDEQPTKSHYLLGNDPKRWRTYVPTYARVECEEVYPGVDVVYYGAGGTVEYDFVVAPGADPGRIRVSITGAERAELDSAGDLLLHAGGETIRQRRPEVYQESDGVREPVESEYVLLAKGGGPPDEEVAVAFRLGEYDPDRPLVIDPMIVYSTYLGGWYDDTGYDVAVDAAGCAYVVGSTNSPDFPVAGAFQSASAGSVDAFVAKFNSEGTGLVYSTYLGGWGDDHAHGVRVDDAESAYVCGDTASGNFPVQNALQPLPGGQVDAFVTKLDPSGASLVYSTYVGGGSYDYARALEIDDAGAGYVTGYTSSSSFPATSGAYRTPQGGGYDTYLFKLQPSGAALTYSARLGGSSYDYGFSLTLDGAGNAWVAGTTYSSDFPTVSAFQSTIQGYGDAFVAQVSADGSALGYATYLGGSGHDYGYDVALNAAGDIHVSGRTESSDFPILNAISSTYWGSGDAFVTKLASGGGALVFSTYLGYTGVDAAYGLSVDNHARIYAAGQTGLDAFLRALSPEGLSLYALSLGGTGEDTALDLALDGSNNVYVVGRTTSMDYPLANAYQTANRGGRDAFLTKVSGPPLANPVMSGAWAGETEITVEWYAVTGATQYELQRKHGTESFATIAWVPQPDFYRVLYRDTGLAVNTTYTYRVRAWNEEGFSGWSSEISATTELRPPAAPKDLTATALSASEIALAWVDQSATEDGFDVYRSADGVSFGWIERLPADTTSYTDTGLTSSTTYYYRVRAFNAAGYSESNTASATTLADSPTAPNQLAAVVPSSSTIELSWSDNSTNETGFEVERADGTAGFARIASLPADSTGYADTAAVPGVEYRYRVRAVNGSGGSPYSNEVSVTIPQGGVLRAPSSLSLGASPGKVARKSFNIKNAGSGTLMGRVGTLAAPFRVAAGEGLFSLAPGTSLSVTVEFAPTSRGTYTATLVITNTDPSRDPHSVSITGKAR